MDGFMQRVADCNPKQDQIGLIWLGQAGFLVKTAAGRLIAIDPYLSEYVMRLFPENGLGFKRLMAAPCTAEELVLDVLLISHEHADHFDVDSIAALMSNGRTQVYTSHLVAGEMKKLGLDMSRVHPLARDEQIRLDGFSVTAVDCDHGELTPDALGFILDFGFIKLYYAGDTALTPERLQTPLRQKPEIAILPINGAFGNLDGRLAARYAAQLECKVCVPCHFWTFPLHHGDPQQIIDAMPEEAPSCKLCLMCQGEACLLP